jgi:hypothetical protein
MADRTGRRAGSDGLTRFVGVPTACTAVRISLTLGAGLPARQRHGVGEVRKPRHLNPAPLPAGHSIRKLPSLALRQHRHPQRQPREATHQQRNCRMPGRWARDSMPSPMTVPGGMVFQDPSRSPGTRPTTHHGVCRHVSNMCLSARVGSTRVGGGVRRTSASRCSSVDHLRPRYGCVQ